jgi:cytochrome b561
MPLQHSQSGRWQSVHTHCPERTMATTSAPAKFTPLQRWLHWTMALLVLVVYLVITQRDLFARGSDGRALMLQAHFWTGLLLFVMVWWRLWQRRRHPAPPVAPPLPMSQRIVGASLHVALYLFFIVMPVLGLATAWTDGKGLLLPLAGTPLPALLAPDRVLAHTLQEVHETIGTVFYWVIGLHVLAALYHHLLRRDTVLTRML